MEMKTQHLMGRVLVRRNGETQMPGLNTEQSRSGLNAVLVGTACCSYQDCALFILRKGNSARTVTYSERGSTSFEIIAAGLGCDDDPISFELTRKADPAVA